MEVKTTLGIGSRSSSWTQLWNWIRAILSVLGLEPTKHDSSWSKNRYLKAGLGLGPLWFRPEIVPFAFLLKMTVLTIMTINFAYVTFAYAAFTYIKPIFLAHVYIEGR